MQQTAPTSEPRFRWVLVTAAALLLAVAMGILVNGMSAFLGFFKGLTCVTHYISCPLMHSFEQTGVDDAPTLRAIW